MVKEATPRRYGTKNGQDTDLFVHVACNSISEPLAQASSSQSRSRPDMANVLITAMVMRMQFDNEFEGDTMPTSP